MQHFDYRGDDLHAEDLPVADLAERFGTPLFVYSHTALTDHIRSVAAAFAAVGLDPLIAYSVKANPNLAVIRTLVREGAGADVVSGGELVRALRAGVPAEKVVFSGVGKRQDELALGVERGILCFNVEVAEELEALGALARSHGREVAVALRVNPDVDAGTHRYISVGRRIDKFGIPLDQAAALYARAAATPGLRVRGFACHIGSQLTRLEPVREALGRLASLVEEVRAAGHPVDLLDVGGGLGVRYTTEEPPSPAEYAAAVHAAVGQLDVRLILEPGRVIAANAGLFLTRVLYRKEVGGKRFLIVDGAMNDVTRPALYGAVHEVWPARRGGAAIAADLVGPICESGDFLARDAELPDARPGDLLALRSAGAYCRSMSSNYNTRPRAAEVLVRGGEAHLVQRRETVDDLLGLEQVPGFLT